MSASDSPRKKTSNEFFYLDENGEKQDALLHNEILDYPEAEAAFAAERIRDAVLKRGMTLEHAMKLYGDPEVIRRRSSASE
jgi:hypothetical protein